MYLRSVSNFHFIGPIYLLETISSFLWSPKSIPEQLHNQIHPWKGYCSVAALSSKVLPLYQWRFDDLLFYIYLLVIIEPINHLVIDVFHSFRICIPDQVFFFCLLCGTQRWNRRIDGDFWIQWQVQTLRQWIYRFVKRWNVITSL